MLFTKKIFKIFKIFFVDTSLKELPSLNYPITNDELLFSDIAGQAYFARAWAYFDLTRLFKDIPLWTR